MQRKDPTLLDQTKEAIASADLANCIDIGIDPGDHVDRLPLMRQVGVSWYTLGIYPSYARDPRLKEYLLRLETDIRQQLHLTPEIAGTGNPQNGRTASGNEYGSPAHNPRLVAIGEIGVDFFHDYGSDDEQKALFNTQIDIANRFSLPIVIHNRDADASIAAAIKQNPPLSGGILHCFSSDFEVAKTLLDYGFYVSFAGNISYSTAHQIRDAAAKVPADRILAETDSPYLSPVPFRGKANKPPHVTKVYECLAEQRNQDLEELCIQVEKNVFRFVGMN